MPGARFLYEKHDTVNEDVRSDETLDRIEQAWVDGNPMRYRQHALRFDAFVGIERQRQTVTEPICLDLLQFVSQDASLIGWHDLDREQIPILPIARDPGC